MGSSSNGTSRETSCRDVQNVIVFILGKLVYQNMLFVSFCVSMPLVGLWMRTAGWCFCSWSVEICWEWGSRKTLNELKLMANSQIPSPLTNRLIFLWPMKKIKNKINKSPWHFSCDIWPSSLQIQIKGSCLFCSAHPPQSFSAKILPLLPFFCPTEEGETRKNGKWWTRIKFLCTVIWN